MDFSNPTISYLIFHNRFPVYIQNKNLYTSDKNHPQALILGYFRSSEEEQDIFFNDWTEVYKTPIELVELFDEGIEFRFVKIEDLAKVYQWLKRHVENWSKVMGIPYSKPAPEQDLVLIDMFAETISKLALNWARAKHFEDKLNLKEPEAFDYIKSLTGVYSMRPITIHTTTELVDYHNTDLADAMETSRAWRHF